MPKVSVIVPNYNHANYLRQRIESILNQTFQDFELILLDDCSTDNSVEILNDYANHPKVKQLIVNKNNSGSTFKQWQKGISIAEGEYIWIAESDDFCEDFFLSILVKVLDGNSSLGLAYSQSKKVNSEGVVIGSWKSYTDDLDFDLFSQSFSLKGVSYIEKFLSFRNTLPNASAVLFRKVVVLKVGMPDSDIKYCADWLFWLKIASIYNIYYHFESLNNFRFHDKSVIATAGSNHYMYDCDMMLRYRQFIIKSRNRELLPIVNQMLASNYLERGMLSFRKNNKIEGWIYAYFCSLFFNFKLGLVVRRFNLCFVQSFSN